VYGVEGDIDVGHIAGSQTNSATGFASIGVSPSLFIGGPSVTATASEATELNWLSTLRARFGFTVLDRLLLFASGGLALGEVRSEGSVTATNISSQIIWSGSHSEIKAGYAVGGGGEWAFADLV
jgi:outer membrane immunogenic protein